MVKTMVIKKLKYSLLALLIVITSSAVAGGVSNNRPNSIQYKPETVTTRERPELEPLGAHAGAFRLFPSLSLSERYSDNIFATNNNEESDFITVINPGVYMQSLWGRHFMAIRADASIGRYSDNNNENYEDFSVGFDGLMEINNAQSLSGGYTYSHEHENRFSADDVAGAEPTELDRNTLIANYQHRFNRIIVDLGGEYQTLDFDDVRSSNGNVIDNDDRDRNRREGSLKVGYEYLPEYTAYVRTSINSIDYDDEIDGNGFNRDSDGYTFSVGTDLDLSGVLFGNLFVGYEKQKYDDRLLNNTKGVSGGASLTWLPSQMTTVSGSLTRSIEETTLNAASGVFSTSANLVVDHELLRNFLLQARLNVSENNFEGISRKDTDFGSGIGARYMLNRHFHLLLDYDYLQRNSDSVTNINDFSENIFSLGGRIQL